MMLFVIYQPQILNGYIILSDNFNTQDANIETKESQLNKIHLKGIGNDINRIEKENSFVQKNLNNENLKELELQDKVYQNILFVLENEKIFTNPNLSILEFSEKVGSNEKYVSNTISNYFKMNYSNLINSYRINEAKRLIYENQSLSLNEIMKASGFNFRTTFYTAFNKHTGMSPTQFKDMKP